MVNNSITMNKLLVILQSIVSGRISIDTNNMQGGGHN